LGGEIGEVAWNLVMKLAVSKEYLEKARIIFKREAKSWEDYLRFSERCQSIYLLYLVECMIGDGSDAELAEIRKEPSSEERTALRLSILNSKAILHAIKYIQSLEGYVIQDIAIHYIRMSLRMISTYVVESMRANEKLPTEFQLYEYKVIQEDIKSVLHKPNNIPISNFLLKFNRNRICRNDYW
jgi:hypothetical protein